MNEMNESVLSRMIPRLITRGEGGAEELSVVMEKLDRGR